MRKRQVLVSFIFLMIVMTNAYAETEYYTTLRYEFAQKNNYVAGWFLAEERKLIITAFRDENYKKVLHLSDEWLSKYPVDTGVFYLCAIAAHHTSQYRREIKCIENYYGLLSSIIGTGDGLSEKTAFKVISVNEEYDVIRAYGGLLKKQSLIQGKETVFDLMEIDVDGQLLKLFFDISVSFNN